MDSSSLENIYKSILDILFNDMLEIKQELIQGIL